MYSTSNAMPAVSLSASGLDYVGNVLQASTEKRVRIFESVCRLASRPVYCACEPKYA